VTIHGKFTVDAQSRDSTRNACDLVVAGTGFEPV